MDSSIVSDKVLSEAKKVLKEIHDDWMGGVTCGRAMDLTGKVTHGVDYGACHAWLSHAFGSYCRKGYSWAADYKDDAKNFLILSAHSKKRSEGICKPEAHEALIRWMASDDCVFSKYIINRDDEDSLLNGGVIILCGPDGADNATSMWICKALRYAVEASNAVDVWYALHQRGVDGVFALYVASFVRTVRGATFGYTGLEGHSCVFSNEVNVEQILKKDPKTFAVSTAGIFSKSSGSKSYVPQLQKFCKPIQIDDGWGGKIAGSAATIEEFCQNVLDIQKQVLSKLEGKEEVKGTPAAKKPTKSTVFLEIDM